MACLAPSTCRLPHRRGKGSSRRLPLLLALLVALCSCRGARGSEGDESEVFQQCHSSCYTTGCTKTPGSANTCDTVCGQRPGHSYRPPLSLQLMRWDCSADCSYHCMWALEGPKAAAAAGPVVKYFGKWPFIRVWGMQEAASVLFSLANLAAHVHNLRLFLRLVYGPGRQQTHGSSSRGGGGSSGGSSALKHHQHPHHPAYALYPYAGLWVAYAAVNINAWLWSAVFHCRDTRLTERLDYFSADLVVAVGLGVVAARALALTSRRRLGLLAAVVGMCLLQHVHYMAFVKFDYGYNMSVCIGVGLATAAAWLVWAARARHPGRGVLYRFMALVHAAMLLEVLDFPPLLWLFDAHALWHAATVPLTFLWYRFVAADVAAVCGGGGGHHAQPAAAAAAAAAAAQGGDREGGGGAVGSSSSSGGGGSLKAAAGMLLHVQHADKQKR